MGDMGVSDPKKTVLVTGFGPFGGWSVNASWQVVKRLSQLGLEDEDVSLIIEEVPVVYECVNKRIPELWQLHEPKLVVHCGLHSSAMGMVFERLAHNYGYCRLDVDGNIPPEKCCVFGEEKTLTTSLDLNQICQTVNESCDVRAMYSLDAGRYLCEYIYYQSLYWVKRSSGSAAVFVHIPPLDAPYSLDQLAQALRLAIHCMLVQLHETR